MAVTRSPAPFARHTGPGEKAPFQRSTARDMGTVEIEVEAPPEPVKKAAAKKSAAKKAE